MSPDGVNNYDNPDVIVNIYNSFIDFRTLENNQEILIMNKNQEISAKEK